MLRHLLEQYLDVHAYTEIQIKDFIKSEILGTLVNVTIYPQYKKNKKIKKKQSKSKISISCKIQNKLQKQNSNRNRTVCHYC
jgi:hypothetical protein